MKYASFVAPNGEPAFGRVEGDRVVELTGLDDLKTAIAASSLPSLAPGRMFDLGQVDLLPVIPNPGKILCIGLNYETHRQETGRAEADHPAVFTRFPDTLVGPGAPIVRPAVSEQLDYEGELAVIIGQGGRAIPAGQALGHVAGYACFNDASVRDWQRHNIQFTPGKNFPGTGAFGPWLVTPDEVPDLAAEHVVTRLNGVVVQDQPISDMIWPVAELIAYVSAFTPLSPGDVIATGTPGGVGARRPPPLWMRPGDRVEVEIGSIGLLINPVVQDVIHSA